MTRWLATALLAGFLPLQAAAETVRFGVFMGNDRGRPGEATLEGAEREAGDLASIFHEIGGLSRERTFVLKGASVKDFRETVRNVEAQIRESEARGDDALLVFYYSGHGSRNGLHLGDEVLPMEDIEAWLRTSAAQARIAFVDACESGALARVRGGTPVDVIDLHIDDALLAYGYAVVTSSGPQSVARETADLGGGVFSRALITGLRGGADEDQDGAVSLEEVYNHAFRETVLDTVQTGRGVQRPEYHTAMVGVGQVVLTRVSDRAAGLVLPAELEGTYTVVSVTTGQVVAEVRKQPGEHGRVALRPGRYLVRKVRQTDVLVAELDLAWGGDRWVEDAQMVSVPLGDPLSRGAGPFDRPIRVFGSVSGITPMAAANPFALGGELGIRMRRGNLGGVFAAGFDQGRRDTPAGRLQGTTTHLRAGVALQKHHARFDLFVGGGVIGMAMRQYLEINDDGRGPEFTNVARQMTAGAYGEVGGHLPIGPSFGLVFGSRLALYPVLTDTVQAFYLRGGAQAGLAMRFGGRRGRGRLNKRHDPEP